MSERGAAALAAALLLGAGRALAAPVEVLDLPFAVEEMRAPGSHASRVLPSTDAARRDRRADLSGAAVVWGAKGAAALVLSGGTVRAVPIPPPGPEAFGERPGDALAGSRIAQEGPVAAILSAPTDAYRHGVFGKPVEAGRLSIRERQPVAPGGGVQRVPVRVTNLEAGPGAVFEDREPRLADLDRDGVAEVLVVRTQLDRGASLAVVGSRGDAWSIVAETPPIGEPGRWLNPAAAADFEGSGRPTIALVRMPHRTGMLQLWAFDGRSLLLRGEVEGYSNHAYGSPAQGLAAAADVDGDGAAELAIPTLDRRSLALVAFKGGMRERWRVPLPSPALHGVAALGTGRDLRFVVGLEDGRVAVVRP